MAAPAFRYGTLLLAGMYAVSLAERLPATPALSVGALAAVVLAVLARRLRIATLLVAAGAGLMVADGRLLLEDRLDAELVGADLDLVVRVTDFAQPGSVIRMLVEPVDAPELPLRLRLSWYDAPSTPALGECWAMTVRLRRPRGFANPGRFDYEAWLAGRRVGATGYVRAARYESDCAPRLSVQAMRRALAARLRSVLPDDDAAAVLLAITLGARQWIDDRRWDVFSITGTSHLMAISGMHVALASGGVFLLARLLLGLAGIAANHRHLASAAALVFAGLYAALSGLGVPSRRAFLMLFVAVVVALWRRPVSAWQVFGLAMIVVAIGAPLDVLSAGFKLSFAAVALLLLLAVERPQPGIDSPAIARRIGRAAAQLGVLQVTLLFGLLPLTASYFGRVSWVAPIANFTVLPLFNLVALPAALIGAMSSGFPGDFILLVAWRTMRLLLDALDVYASVPLADLQLPMLGPYGVCAVLLAAAATLLPRGWPMRGLRWIALLALVAGPVERPPRECVDIDVLDVGQGLAAVLQTANATVVYDTGPAFQSGSDTGRLVVAPFLDYRGIDHVDLLIISHADLDHAGGMESLLEATDVGAIMLGEPLRRDDYRVPAIACEAGQFWQLDGIGFVVLHPQPGLRRDGNNASCVVEVRAGNHSLLLTGDIEAVVERDLLRQRLLDPVTAVVVPHHGSKTSSHSAFVRRLTPELAIGSAGFDNRWGLPKPEVAARWRNEGASFLNTGDDGAVGLRLCADRGLTLRYRARHHERRFWHEP